ncbi:MAG: DUF6468 domain-containing protein [Alphaproteobacteria bacterium]|nr:DUF6468 domain-containing protein [Alphaproteobacteria bacterium]
MSWSDPGLIVNALVAALLVAVIVHAVMLNRRLKSWRAEAGELERLIVTFNGAIQRAENALAGLKQGLREDGQTFDVAHKRAAALRDDLAYLVERGGSLADRLERAVRDGLAQQPAEADGASPAAAVAPAPAAREPAAKAAGPKTLVAPASARPVSDAEKRLKAALETMR